MNFPFSLSCVNLVFSLKSVSKRKKTSIDRFLLLKDTFHTSKLNKVSDFKVLLLEALMIFFQAHSQLLIK